MRILSLENKYPCYDSSTLVTKIFVFISCIFFFNLLRSSSQGCFFSSRLFFQFKVIYIFNKKNLKGNWRQIFPLFLAQYIPLRLKNPKWANKRYIVQNQIFYKFFLTLNRRPFWKRSYTRVTRHTCVRQWKASCQDLKVTTSALLSSCCWNLRAE